MSKNESGLFHQVVGYDVLATIDDIEYVHSGDDEHTIIALSRKHQLAADTTFYEMDDMEYPGSDYAFIVNDGALIPRHELPSNTSDPR
jgi:hypothetical protein